MERFVIVTLDSCRYDTALRACPSFLTSIAPLQEARAMASFTLPAHVALFNGYPPEPINPLGPPSVIKDTFRHRRNPNNTVRGSATGSSWFDELRNSGWYVSGFGGMRWFQSKLLTSYFDSFDYVGPTYTNSDRDIPTWRSEDYPLSTNSMVLRRISRKKQWVAFINMPETHCPYMIDDANLLNIMRRHSSYRNGKMALPTTSEVHDLMSRLHTYQEAALLVADRRLRELFDALPRPFSFLVTADHGESFGEDGIWGHVHNNSPVARVPLWQGEML